ncbi:hypothetical protein FHX81_7860 [Saccharothrix saharensis]|uniref:Uncharacterized protein n=1 Tax=Saccharothrix saharensis TaxID=571190 RepID=A0A543JRC0_9PSEU|nr:hypothetical protein [Saccharothrix saharensis]TQM85380.1 hypothetical protein FHX81_7860 [Saccharothrix saharensis]
MDDARRPSQWGRAKPGGTVEQAGRDIHHTTCTMNLLPARSELIARTRELSLDLLSRRGHHLARPFLRLLSCFGPAPIPVDVLDARLPASVPMWATITRASWPAAPTSP